MGNVHMEATQINYRGGSKKMSVEEAIKAAGTEITPEEKAWIDTIPELATQEIIAPEFDAEEGVYAVGDLVIYQGKLYEFTSAHETAGEWDSTEVTEKTVADEIDDVKSGLINESSVLGVPKNVGKNKLPLVIDRLKSINTIGSWNGNTYTQYGVAFECTVDSDGCVTNIKVSSEGATGNTSFIINNVEHSLFIGYYTFVNLTLSGNSSNDFRLQADIYENGVYKSSLNVGIDNEPTKHYSGDLTIGASRIYISSGSVITDIDVTPQLEIGNTATAFAEYKPSIYDMIIALENAIANIGS